MLIDTIRETLTQGMIRGDNIRDMTKAIAEKLGSSLKNAERVVRTETSHIHNTAEIEAYKAGGYEEYEYMASFGEKTCEKCGGLDGQHFKLTDIQYGVNFPPVHTNCRCTTVCWDEADEEHKALEGQKALDYEEWYQKYVENREQPKLESKDGAAVEIPKQPASPAPVIPNSKEIDVEVLTNVQDSDIIIQEIKNTSIRGDIHIPPTEIDVDTLAFDKSHVVAERTHDVSENEAKSFINNSNVSISRWNGRFENYFSSDGAAYVDTEEKTIRTAFSSREYDDVTKAMMEVLRKYGKL